MRFIGIILIALCISTQAFGYGADGCDSKTLFLSHFDGANGATTATDEACNGTAARVMTAVNNAKIDSTDYRWGQSTYLDGANDHWTIPDSDDWDFGTEDFTVDGWCKFKTGANYAQMFDHQLDLSMSIKSTDSGNPSIQVYLDNGVKIDINKNTVAVGQWFHWALVRKAPTLYVFLNGVLWTSVADSTNITAGANTMWFGERYDGLYDLDGWLDEVRIVRGKALWIQDFTPPTSPYCSGCEMV